MKSLEIVDSCLYIIDYNRRQMSEEELLMNIDGYFVKENELEQIKQDLEVLEIIRKKVDFRFMGTCLQVSGENNTKWTFIKEFNLSKEKEEYSKFKKWLETNKEGDYND